MVFPHLPERVLRQYGHVQSIPRDPVISARPLMNAFQIQHAFQDYLVKNYVTLQMRGPRFQNSWDNELGYIAWFYSVSHPKLWPPVEGGPPRPANVEVLIEGDDARNVEICRKVRSNIKASLDNGPDLELYEQTLQKAYDDLDLATTYQVRQKGTQ
jgi:hypothetical protein